MRTPGPLGILQESAELRRAEAALAAGRPAWIEGLAGTAKTAAIAATAGALGRVTLVVTADEGAAEQLIQDLPAFGLAPGRIGLYPGSEPDFVEALPEAKVAASSEAHEQRALARSRVAVLEALAEGRLELVAAPIHAVLRATVGPLAHHRLGLKRGANLELESAARQLVELGYERVTQVEQPGQFAIRGGLVDVFPATRAAPIRIELFGDEIESIREFDPASQRSSGAVDAVTLAPAAELLAAPASESAIVTLLEHLPPGSLVVLDEPTQLRARWLEFKENQDRQRELAAESEKVLPEHVNEVVARSVYLGLESFLKRLEPYRRLTLTLLAHSMPWLRRLVEDVEHVAVNSGVVDGVGGDLPELANRLRSWLGAGNRVAIASDQPHRITELLVEQGVPVRDATAGEPAASGAGAEVAAPDADPAAGPPGRRPMPVQVYAGRLSSGFWLPGARFYLLTDAEVFGRHDQRAGAAPVTRRFKEGRPILSLAELREGDLVVHVNHGIGRYRGLERRTVGGVEREFLRIDYQDPDRLFVPSDQLDRVQKYIGADGAPPTIHRIGGGEWFRTRARVKARVKEMAKELLQLYAARQALAGHAYGEDTVWQQEMEAAFPYQETGDQLQAIQDVKGDMETPRPMDRLVCGDVGYGKTEVAIRAAFKAVVDGKQVAVLCPTTILAQQHFQTFAERFGAFPVRVEVLSRFRSRAEQKKVLEDLALGQVDVIIGTHRLLSKDVQFHNLGLLVVDEEQRFGVAHKEKVKQLRRTVDTLTLTATPIPRTLHMALSGIREMSVIEDPPEGRLAVRTYCLEADERILREAILREIDRGGQVYYVHNRIETIHREAEKLQRLVPQARIRIGHGQMADTELEDVMLDFYEHKFDLLLCTTIIENGLDIPNANTMIMNDADHLGLAQLHQLRGRVGRSVRQAYCYLLYKPFKELTETAEKRLQAVRDFTDLGAGFRIALRDLEIRGAGNLLGGEQHGFLVSVGFDLYCQMIQEAIRELKGEETDEVMLPAVMLPIPGLIPAAYLPTDGLRIAFYRKIAACRTAEEVTKVQEELEDRFGDPPRSVWNLLALMRLRIQCIPAGVARIEADPKRGCITFWMARRMESSEKNELLRQFRRAQFASDRVLLYYDGDNPLRVVETLVAALEKRGGKAAAQAVQRQLAAAEAAAESKLSGSRVPAGAR
jgi:transcription-repair coupling factor (superfamily II helicase)